MENATSWAPTIQAFTQWLLAAGRQPSTVYTRTRWLSLLSQAYPQATPATITTVQLQEWLSNPRWKPATKKNALGTVRRFFYYLEITGTRPENPARLLLSVKVPRGKARPIPAAALQQGLDNTQCSEDIFMLLLAAYAGLRRFEIAKLHTQDYREGWITVQGKGLVTRSIPAHPVLLPYLEMKTQGYYFPGRFAGHRHPDYIGKRISALLGEGFTTHQLRHWFATTTYARCKDIRAVQELLGHADISTTQSYIGLDDAALTQAIQALTDLPAAPQLTGKTQR
ncbi:tyrosine-type recombinase/integrase [Rothia nasimurium]|uniref:tyrosine-type recombinase/integrase n=1 Tax=Rothia nasimurium TaxID=85336 RepID=UPI0023515F2A|nr:tyrosine-type recombinase/integrase [Rothia nasimurium]